jgi:hypothetical protein
MNKFTLDFDMMMDVSNKYSHSNSNDNTSTKAEEN